MSPGPEPVEILLVEDNPGDVRLTQEALKEGEMEHNLNVVGDGEEALDFLHQQAEFEEAPPTHLVLLDLNLPKRDGREVLAEIKEDERLRRIPVIVLTTSEAEQDVMQTYDLHANCYITKPVDLDEFVDVVQSIERFWLSVVQLPP